MDDGTDETGQTPMIRPWRRGSGKRGNEEEVTAAASHDAIYGPESGNGAFALTRAGREGERERGVKREREKERERV